MTLHSSYKIPNDKTCHIIDSYLQIVLPWRWAQSRCHVVWCVRPMRMLHAHGACYDAAVIPALSPVYAGLICCRIFPFPLSTSAVREMVGNPSFEKENPSFDVLAWCLSWWRICWQSLRELLIFHLGLFGLVSYLWVSSLVLCQAAVVWRQQGDQVYWMTFKNINKINLIL